MAHKLQFERVFATSLEDRLWDDWIQIEQGFTERSATQDRDRVVRVRLAGPDTGSEIITSWEEDGIRVKHTKPANLPVGGWEATVGQRSRRLSRLDRYRGEAFSLDRYPVNGLPLLATFTFTNIENARSLEAPEWTTEELTTRYRFLSRTFPT